MYNELLTKEHEANKTLFIQNMQLKDQILEITTKVHAIPPLITKSVSEQALEKQNNLLNEDLKTYCLENEMLRCKLRKCMGLLNEQLV